MKWIKRTWQKVFSSTPAVPISRLDPSLRLSENGGVHLVRVEGSKGKAYRDSGQKWTIGVGHLLTAPEVMSGYVTIGGVQVAWEEGLSDTQIVALLRQDVGWAVAAVHRFVTVPLNQHQFDALVSFVFNVGSGNFKGSTLLKRVNAGVFDQVPGEMMKWVYAGGQRIKGLVYRRTLEGALWRGE